ncbi:MAG: peptidoglycan-binding protein [Cyanobacteria bacterium P01_D01_bin.14]
MIRRSTLLLISSLTACFTASAVEAATASRQLSWSIGAAPLSILAQVPAPAEPPSSAPAAPFSVNPAESTNTDVSVPDLSNPQARPTADALQPSGQAESVQSLQTQLQQRGYYEGPVDGLYGSNTQQAVKSLQQDAGLPVTGQVDPPTLQQLTQAGPISQAESPDDPAEAVDEEATDGEAGAPTESETASEVTEPVIENPEASEAAGSKQWLWPGIALVAALGSFGIGFALFNRGKDDDLIQENDAPWGAVSPDLQHSMLPNSTGTTAASTVGSTPSAPNVLRSSTPPAQSYGATAAQNGSNGQGIGGNAISPAADAMPPAETTRLPKVNIVDELVEDLRAPDPTRRRKAIWELGQRGNSTAVQPLVNAMVGTDSKEKSLILAALSEIGIRSLKPMNRALAIALQDENPEVRKNAIRDLTRIYDLVAQISQMLGHATEDEDAEVRQTANWALEQLGRIRKLPEIKNSLPTLEAQPHPAELLPGDRSN